MPSPEKIIAILEQAKSHVTEDSDTVWTRYETGTEIRHEIDGWIEKLKAGDLSVLKEIDLAFAPTSDFQEHAVQNGWSEDYLKLSKKFDRSMPVKNPVARLKKTPIKTSMTWRHRLGHIVLFYIPITALLLAGPGLFSSWWSHWISGPCTVVVCCCWFLPMICLFGWRILFGGRNNREIESPKPALPPQELCTLRFQCRVLQICDDMKPECDFNILPGEYRLFLFRGDETEDFNPIYAVLTTFSVPPSRKYFDAVEHLSKKEIVIDSGMIGLMEPGNDSVGTWFQGQDGKAVAEIRMLSDRTIDGIKLCPAYGDGDYRVFCETTETDCSLLIELQTSLEE